MSSPVSTKLAPPTYIDPRVRRRYILVYLIQIWISLLPATFLCYWAFIPDSWQYALLNLIDININIFYLLVPFIAAIIYTITIYWSAIITKLHLGLLNVLHAPEEGLFVRSLKDRDYVYWNKRNIARLFLFWLLHSTPFTFLKKQLSFEFFGMQIGKGSTVNHVWLSPEFVSIGENVTVGQGACIYSFMFEKDKLLVAKVTIGDNVLIGPQAVILPGTSIENHVTLDAAAFTSPFSKLSEDGVYHGTPAQHIRDEKPK